MPGAFADLPTPLVADACVRCGVPLRATHSGIRAGWLSPRRSVNVSRRRRGVRGRLPRCGRSLRAAARARRVAAPSGRLAATVALQRRHHAKLAG
jgi:hypothetical protein